LIIRGKWAVSASFRGIVGYGLPIGLQDKGELLFIGGFSGLYWILVIRFD
jgi:hypothetical protein